MRFDKFTLDPEELIRVIQQYIGNPLSLEIIKGNIAAADRVNADIDDAKIVFKPI